MALARAVGMVLGILADEVFADPRRGHPVALFGQLATELERRDHRDSRVAGVVHVGVLVGATVLIAGVVERAGRQRPLLRVVSTAAATWAVLGGTTLAAEGTAMGRALADGDLDSARTRISHLCGRDPDSLDGPALARATVESIAENTSDAVVAPLLWGAVGGVPGLLGYRAVNTLDAMIGHRNERYRRFGWCAARTDDLMNLVPSRVAALLTVAATPVIGGSAVQTWRTWRLDAQAHPSPNAGQVEAAFAGALQVRLGGRTVYPYGVEQRPVLGSGRNPDSGHVTRSVELARVVSWASAVLSATLALLFERSAR